MVATSSKSNPTILVCSHNTDLVSLVENKLTNMPLDFQVENADSLSAAAIGIATKSPATTINKFFLLFIGIQFVC